MNKTILKESTIAAVAIMMLSAVLPTANAEDTHFCLTSLESVLGATSSLSTQDKNGLERKIMKADTKLSTDPLKIGDALDKLQDFKDKVVALDEAVKEKISDVDADLLKSSVDEAISCVESL